MQPAQRAIWFYTGFLTVTGMVYCPNCILKNGKIEKSQQWGKVWYGISFEVSAMVLLVWCVELACVRKTKEYSQEL